MRAKTGKALRMLTKWSGPSPPGFGGRPGSFADPGQRSPISEAR